MISFIVLHYKNIDETIECMKNLKKLKNQQDISIIIVDNHTLSEEEYQKLCVYTNDIICLEQNLGYSKANNIGIKYAKEKYNSDFYFVINNDVFIFETDIVKKIKENYNKYSFDVLGPKIDSPTGESINPFPVISDVNYEIKRCKKLIKIYKNPFLSMLLKNYINIKHLLKKPQVKENGEKIEMNVPLHGCAILFSKKYVDRYEKPFYDEIFLFHEEEFLYMRVLKDKLISIYNPEICVFHKEGSSIKKDNKIERKSKLFRESERLKSLEILKKLDGGYYES